MWQCLEGINRLYLQAAYKRVSLERKVANRVLLSDGLATRDDELAEESGGRGAILATRWRQAAAARAIGHFSSQRLKAQTAPQRQKNFTMPGPLACFGPITCLPALRNGPATLFFLQSASSRPSAAPLYCPSTLLSRALVRRAATFRHPLRRCAMPGPRCYWDALDTRHAASSDTAPFASPNPHPTRTGKI